MRSYNRPDKINLHKERMKKVNHLGNYTFEYQLQVIPETKNNIKCIYVSVGNPWTTTLTVNFSHRETTASWSLYLLWIISTSAQQAVDRFFIRWVQFASGPAQAALVSNKTAELSVTQILTSPKYEITFILAWKSSQASCVANGNVPCNGSCTFPKNREQANRPGSRTCHRRWSLVPHSYTL